MKIVRDEARILRLARISQALNLVGLAILMVGLALALSSADNSRLIIVQLFTLLVGISIWQFSLNYGYKYVRRPRPDQQLDEALKAALPTATLYHYVLPAPHVYMTRSGPIVLVPKTQTGRISVSGTNGDRWRRREALWRRFLIQGPPLGNPTREADVAIADLVKYIKERAPELEEVPIGVLIVWVAPRTMVTLDVEQSRIPVTHVSELKKVIRKGTGRPLPREQYDRLLEIFDAAQSKGVETTEEAGSETAADADGEE